jgi:PAS domain S-box-containing protein
VDEIIRRKATEEALRASSEKHRLLFEQSRDAIAIATSDGQFIDVNPAYERLLGYCRDELMEMNAENIWCDREERNHWRQTMEAKGFVTNYECRQRRKDRSELTMHLTSTQRREADGRLIYQDICRDITRDKQADAEREQLIAGLQKTLAEVKTPSGMLPICASCKRIRDDQGYWQQIESYISAHSETVFSHGVCPDCARVLYPGLKSAGRPNSSSPVKR